MKNKSTKSAFPNQCTLYLLRHGEIATPGILAGKTDVALSSTGRQQLQHVLGPLQGIQHCISSPLVRCHEMADVYALQNNLPITTESQLQEMNFGDWDGKRYQDLWDMPVNDGNSSIGDFWQNPWQHQPPHGETMENFVIRVDSWWQNFINSSTLQDTLVITHAGVIKHLLARVLGLPIPGTNHMSAIEVPYAGLIKISLYRDDNSKVWPKVIL